MKSRAAVAFAPGKPLEIVEIDVAPPKKGEVLIKVTHTVFAIPTHLPSPAMTRKVSSRWFSVTKGPGLLLKSVKA